MHNNCNIDSTQQHQFSTESHPYTRENVRAVIVEQPASKSLRFRYQCEGRSAGSIPGVNSTSDIKTFPSIRVDGYIGPAVIVVSCVSEKKPHWPHPHNLVGKETKHGVLTHKFFTDSTVSFNFLGIQCVRRNEIDESLQKRENLKIDPFRTGYGHRKNPKRIDLNVVRLCFQVFLTNADGKIILPLKPIVSDPIYDKKSKTDLIINDLSDNSSSVIGGRKIILLCEKVLKENINVRFYEEIDGKIMWEAFGEFTQNNVFRQVAISFKTPPYKTIDIDHPVCVFIQLQRATDKMTSEPLQFFYTPDDTEMLKRKKHRKVETSYTPESFNYVTENAELQIRQQYDAVYATNANAPKTEYNTGGYNIMGPAPSFTQRTNPLCQTDQNFMSNTYQPHVPKTEYNSAGYNLMCPAPSFSQRINPLCQIEPNFMPNTNQQNPCYQDYNTTSNTGNNIQSLVPSSSTNYHTNNWDMTKNTTLLPNENYGYPVSYAHQIIVGSRSCPAGTTNCHSLPSQQNVQKMTNFQNVDTKLGVNFAHVQCQQKMETVAEDEIDEMTDSFTNIL